MKLEEVLDTDLKPKEKVAKIVSEITNDHERFNELIELFRSGNDVIKGTCAEVMKFIAQDHPELFLPHLNELITYINYPFSRVKWEIPRSIGYIAETYPDKVGKAVLKLLENTKDKSTVVRWCAAFGLTGIAKHNLNLQSELVQKFEQIVKREQNNGVENVYKKALKQIQK